MKRLTALLATTLLLFAACEQATLAPFTHSYAETLCADPWASLVGTDGIATVEDALEQYLTDEGIDLIDVAIEAAATDFITCQACQCSSGRSLRVQVDTSDFAALETLGFVRL
ncbi:MAG: hypothetical protein OHK0039_38120 [Bacteroidia bacterium]